jgi:hypothetical protein
LWDRVARVCGARAALLEGLGSSLPPIHPAALEDTVNAARRMIGEESFVREYAAGKRLLPKQAVDQGLPAG